MSFHVPFHEETYIPKTIKGNETDDRPVRFLLSAAGGADLARLKSIILASSGLALSGSWSPETQKAVISAFNTGADVFINTIDGIENLTVPAALAVKAGMFAELPARTTKETPIEITTGRQFAKICGWLPVLAMEVAFELTKISDEADVDPRFFVSPTTSRGKPTGTNGSVAHVRKRRGARGTAGSATSTADTATTTNP